MSSSVMYNTSDVPLSGNSTGLHFNSSQPMAEILFELRSFFETLGYAVLVLYLATFVFGVAGNSLTILVILKNNRMKTVATCFILNLAVADNLFMLSLPFMAHSTFTKNWVFGTALCKIMDAFFGINMYASIFTMVLMSIDRYLAVGHPLKSLQYRTNKNAALVCVLVWLVCLVIMTPYWLYADVMSRNGTDGLSSCKVLWPEENFEQYVLFWNNFELIIGFAVPILVMVACYLLLVKHLVFNSGPVQLPTKKPIKKVTVMIFMVTLVFVLCWTPYRIFKYVSMERARYFRRHGLKPSVQETINSSIFQTVAQALVFISSCCNPFIYAISSRNFRRLYLAALCWTASTIRRRRYTQQHASSRCHMPRAKAAVMTSHLLDQSCAVTETERATDTSCVIALERMPLSLTQNGRVNCVRETSFNGL